MVNSKNHPLETQRLLLRLPQTHDAQVLSTLIDAWEVAVTTLRIPHPYDLEMAESWIQSVQERDDKPLHFSYIIVRKSDQQVVGGCGFHVIPEHDKAEIGYWLGVPYWGNGYATEAAQRVIQFCFEDLRLNRVQADYFVGNEASRRVMEKAGMTFEGIARQALIRHIPSKNHRVYHDIASCAILRSEWEATKG